VLRSSEQLRPPRASRGVEKNELARREIVCGSLLRRDVLADLQLGVLGLLLAPQRRVLGERGQSYDVFATRGRCELGATPSAFCAGLLALPVAGCAGSKISAKRATPRSRIT
jgi:hypothetical protein